MKTKIKKGDTVEIISGRSEEKGRRGEVIKVNPKSGRVAVQGINIRKKHQGQYQTQGKNLPSGIIEFESPMHISNVMLVCPSCKEVTRVGFQRDDDGSHRVCKRCDTLID